jgi:RHS repeat-associated protein
MSDGSGSTGWSYDADGRIVTEKRTIGTVTKTTSYSYNEDGSIASVTYPSGRVITYTTGDAGRPLSAVDSANNINYALLASYSSAGAVSSVIYGRVPNGFNGTTEARGYNNRLETTSISASSSNGTATSLSPCYTAFALSSSSCSSTAAGNNGNVTGIVNGVDSNTTLGFSYDALNRILSALTKSSSGSDCWGQGFGPDAVANLTSITASQCSAGSLSASTDGYNHLTNTGYTYDDAGDMTGDGSYTYTYDAEQRITSANSVSYTYDGNGFRVRKSSGTLYWRSLTGDVLAETDSSGNTQNEYVLFAGRRIAQRTSSGSVYFYYADTLGTIHTITNGTGTACYDATFTPYGQEMLNPNISQTCSSNYRFTGYEYDSETGLYYAKARYYNPRLGRFMTTDPLSGNVSNPQSINRYAYVSNNPTNAVDPSGQWSSWVHQSILNLAFPGLSPAQFGILVAASEWVDNFQDADDSYMHGQCSPGQSMDDCGMEIGGFIEGNQDEAAADLFGADDSMWELGEAMHTLSDIASPWHSSADGTPTCWDCSDWRNAEHMIDEDGMSYVEPMQFILNYAKQISQAIANVQAAFDAVFPGQYNQAVGGFGAQEEAAYNLAFSQILLQTHSISSSNMWLQSQLTECLLGNPAACPDQSNFDFQSLITGGGGSSFQPGQCPNNGRICLSF